MKETPLPTIEYPLTGGLKTPGEAARISLQVAEDFSKCGAVEEDPRRGRMTTPFNFPLDSVGAGCVKLELSNRDAKSHIDARLVGIGGAPTRATTLPEAPAERKKFPIASGLLDYFPDALVAISNLSFKGNEQHNPGKPLHWARGKSMDHADTMLRHCLQRGTLDTDGVRHSVKMAWRALALLQCEIEAERD